MNTVANKLICLNLNSAWQPVGFKTVKEAIIALCAADADGKANSLALDINYNILDNGEPDLSEPKSMNPVSWSDWINLPVRSWDFSISSPSMTIRVPTVIISANFSKMPMKHFKGKPSKDAIYNRDRGTCQYTGKKIDRHHATVDHVVPRSRGGEDTWTNLVLCSKEVNTKKGNSLNSEVGLNLLKNPLAPQPVPVYSLIREAKHNDWKHFLIS